jgi:hypothetical protein
LIFPYNDFGHANIEIEEDRGLVGHPSQPKSHRNSLFFVESLVLSNSKAASDDCIPEVTKVLPNFQPTDCPSYLQ